VNKILIFAGTEDGRELAEKLSKNRELNVTLSVATEFGKELVNSDKLKVLMGRLDENQIRKVIEEHDIIIDATHPYAVEISKNIFQAKGNKKLLRLLREESKLGKSVIAKDIKDACSKCDEGHVLAATGSKQIAEYTCLDRVYVRVLPTEESIKLCYDAGLGDNQIIRHFGKNTVEENIEIINKYNIKNLITKDGGDRGGFNEKKEAAERTGIKFIVIKRPEEEGYSLEELLRILGE
jgi:precorrin-6x reductase